MAEASVGKNYSILLISQAFLFLSTPSCLAVAPPLAQMEPGIGSVANAIPSIYGHRAVHDVCLEDQDVPRVSRNVQALQTTILQLGQLSLRQIVVGCRGLV